MRTEFSFDPPAAGGSPAAEKNATNGAARFLLVGLFAGGRVDLLVWKIANKIIVEIVASSSVVLLLVFLFFLVQEVAASPLFSKVKVVAIWYRTEIM